MRVLRALSPDGRYLFVTKFLRMFAFGVISFVLELFAGAAGLSKSETGALLTLCLVGDCLLCLGLGPRADAWGRRLSLCICALLMMFAGVVSCLTLNFTLLLLGLGLGIASPTGKEVGPLQAVEKAMLAQLVPDADRTEVFAYHALVADAGGALGALSGGILAEALMDFRLQALSAYRGLLIVYAGLALLLFTVYTRISRAAEAPVADGGPSACQPDPGGGCCGLRQSRSIVLKLSALFAVDAFAGGLVAQTFLPLWLSRRFACDTGVVGILLLCTNGAASISQLVAPKFAKRFGLLRTMVFTHLPSNVILALVPVCPSFWTASVMLVLRSFISQMDVPTRESFVMAVVHPSERTASGTVTGLARVVGMALSPYLANALFFAEDPFVQGVPFFVAGGLKVLYDLTLLCSMRKVAPPEEVLAREQPLR
eukprot:gnl/TRDRNA2_/TRDRNA2_158235_c3_seq2.p1 gnl/TRDRNA2_/TRDRNA2_158235_c3~~gnl/TRDRNA2_/TRDRNA2_158235_c3_seq2.p1  ORF type:complete len:427 (+),score=62.52 gnl/TRDRNA2_/TRDRNA2_158235_c3_seq2:64-1344(+)